MPELDAPSSLDLDKYLAGEASPELRARVEASAEAMREVERRRAVGAEFLARFPDPASLAEARRAPNRAGERRRIPVARTATVAAAAALAAAAGVVLFLVPPAPPGEAPYTLRAKGGSALELFANGDAHAPLGPEARLHPGDTLELRYRSAQRRLLLLSVEASGRVAVLFDRRLEPGEDRRLDQRLVLDEYLGSELLLAALSDEALDASALERAVAAALESGVALEAVPSRLALDGAELRAWLIRKEPRP